jgi:hypothetical protein
MRIRESVLQECGAKEEKIYLDSVPCHVIGSTINRTQDLPGKTMNRNKTER